MNEPTKYVVIVDHSAGNDSVGEMWQETKIFDATNSLHDVMEWAEGAHGRKLDHSRKRITITRPHP